MKIQLQFFGGRGGSSGDGKGGGGGGGSARSKQSSGKGAANAQSVNTKFTTKELNTMSRSQLETAAKAVAVKRASAQGISQAEALRRANLLMSSQSVPQLKKYIKKYG